MSELLINHAITLAHDYREPASDKLWSSANPTSAITSDQAVYEKMHFTQDCHCLFSPLNTYYGWRRWYSSDCQLRTDINLCKLYKYVGTIKGLGCITVTPNGTEGSRPWLAAQFLSYKFLCHSFCISLIYIILHTCTAVGTFNER